MNLHQLASGAIGIVNPFMQVQILQSTGYTTNKDGSRTPTFTTFTTMAQVQDLTADDLRMVDALNLQGNHKSIYLNGDWNGIIRADGVGGDIFRVNGRDWLVTAVPEQWPDWTKVIVTMQSPKLSSPFVNPPPAPSLLR